jgi:CRP-like cAMP-binding protein
MLRLSDEIKQMLQKEVHFHLTDWANFENILFKRTLKKGDHFFKHFERSDEVALITKGLFRIYFIDENSEEKTFSFLTESDFIIEFFLNWKNSPSDVMISVQALEDSEIYCVRYGAFLKLMKESQEWSDFYREIILKNYRAKTAREIDFVLNNAKQRLLKFVANKKLDFNRIPKTHLASFLGIAPPSLSRIFKELKEDGIQLPSFAEL